MEAVAFVSHGRVEVYRPSRDGKPQTIALLGPGYAFGEIGMVDRAFERERRLTSDASRDRIEPGLTHRELADVGGSERTAEA